MPRYHEIRARLKAAREERHSRLMAKIGAMRLHLDRKSIIEDLTDEHRATPKGE